MESKAKLYCGDPGSLKSKLDEAAPGPRVILYGDGSSGTFLYYRDARNASTNIHKYPNVVFAFGDNIEANEFFRRRYKEQADENWEQLYDKDKLGLALQAAPMPIHQGGGGQAGTMLESHKFYIAKENDNPRGRQNHNNWHYVDPNGAAVDTTKFNVYTQSAYPANVIGIPICMDTGAYKNRSEHIIAALDAAFDELEKHLENGRTIVIPAFDQKNVSIGGSLAKGRMGDDEERVMQHLRDRVKQLQDHAIALEANPEAKKWKDKSFHEMELDYQARIQALEQPEEKKSKREEEKPEFDESPVLILPEDFDFEQDVASFPTEESQPTEPVRLQQEVDGLLSALAQVMGALQPGQLTLNQIEMVANLNHQLKLIQEGIQHPQYYQEAKRQLEALRLSLTEEGEYSFLYNVDSASGQVVVRDDETARVKARHPGPQERHVSPISMLQHAFTDFVEPGMNESDLLKLVLYQIDVLTYPMTQVTSSVYGSPNPGYSGDDPKKQLLDYDSELKKELAALKAIDKQITGKKGAITRKTKNPTTGGKSVADLEQDLTGLYNNKLAILHTIEAINQKRQEQAVHVLFTYYKGLLESPPASFRNDVGQLGMQFLKLFNERPELIMEGGKGNPTPQIKNESSATGEALKALAKAEWKLAHAATPPEEWEKAKQQSPRFLHNAVSGEDKEALQGSPFLDEKELGVVVHHIFHVFDYRPFPKGLSSGSNPQPQDPGKIPQTRYYDEPPDRLFRLAADHLALVFVLCPNLQEQHQLSIMAGFVEKIVGDYGLQVYASHPQWQHLVSTDESGQSYIDKEKVFQALQQSLGERYHYIFDNYKTEEQILTEDLQNTMELAENIRIKLEEFSEQIVAAQLPEQKEDLPANLDEEGEAEVEDPVVFDESYGPLVDPGYGSDEADEHMMIEGEDALPATPIIDPQDEILGSPLPSVELDDLREELPDAKQDDEGEIDEISASGSEYFEEEIEESRTQPFRRAAEVARRKFPKGSQEGESESEEEEYRFDSEEELPSQEEDDYFSVPVLQPNSSDLEAGQEHLNDLVEKFGALVAHYESFESAYSEEANLIERAKLLLNFQLEVEKLGKEVLNFEKSYRQRPAPSEELQQSEESQFSEKSDEEENKFFDLLDEHEDAKRTFGPRDSDEDDEGPGRDFRQGERPEGRFGSLSTGSDGEVKETKKRARESDGNHDQIDAAEHSPSITFTSSTVQAEKEPLLREAQPRETKERRVYEGEDGGGLISKKSQSMRRQPSSDPFRSGPVKKAQSFTERPEQRQEAAQKKKRSREDLEGAPIVGASRQHADERDTKKSKPDSTPNPFKITFTPDGSIGKG